MPSCVCVECLCVESSRVAKWMWSEKREVCLSGQRVDLFIPEQKQVQMRVNEVYQLIEWVYNSTLLWMIDQETKQRRDTTSS